VQLLTFQVGVHLLAVPAPGILSVGREGAETDGTGPATASVDLAAFLGLGDGDAGQRPVIRYRDGTRTVELKVDRILALEHCADGAVKPWPGMLRGLPLYTGAAVIAGRIVQVIDLSTLTARRKGPRR
jgi:hypothetical protein